MSLKRGGEQKNMKKIIISLAVIGVVSAVVIGGTIAYFSDTETSSGNTFTAGTIDIAINGENPWTSHYDIGDLKPGETGYINFDITNEGTNPVNISKTLTSINGTGGAATYACSQVVTSANYSASSEPECVAENGTPIDNVETQIIYDLSVKVYADSGTANLIWWQAIYTDADEKSITDVYGSGTPVTLGMIPVGGHMEVTQSYHFKETAGNEYQGDQLSFDITIKGDQLTSDNGYAQVVLDNKTAGPEYKTIDDDNEATLAYKTQGSLFDFTVNGTVKLADTDYTLLIGVDPWVNPSATCVAGNAMSNSAGVITLSGSYNCGTMTSAKAWLVPTTDWNGGVWAGWNQVNYLLETGLVNYTKN